MWDLNTARALGDMPVTIEQVTPPIAPSGSLYPAEVLLYTVELHCFQWTRGSNISGIVFRVGKSCFSLLANMFVRSEISVTSLPDHLSILVRLTKILSVEKFSVHMKIFVQVTKECTGGPRKLWEIWWYVCHAWVGTHCGLVWA